MRQVVRGACGERRSSPPATPTTTGGPWNLAKRQIQGSTDEPPASATTGGRSSRASWPPRSTPTARSIPARPSQSSGE
eukprot:2298926-Pyramimonas_sp.AAC.1